MAYKRKYQAKSVEEKKEEIQVLTKGMERSIESYYRTPEQMKEYLSFMAKFYKYSTQNISLIEGQFQGATAVGSFNFWKEKGFFVQKGEKGIKILVPTRTVPKFKDEDGKWKSINKASEEEKKKVEEGKTEVAPGRLYFNVGNVFDISQTNATAKDLPRIFPNRWLDGDVKNYKALFKGMAAIAEKNGIKIIEPKSELGVAKGVSYTLTKEVALNPRNTELQNVKTLLHELAHAKLHTKETHMNYTAPEKEFQAEMTAYAVSSYFGIDTSEYSLGYLASWTKGRELNDKAQLIKEVHETSVEFIETIERTLDKESEKTIGKEVDSMAKTDIKDKVNSMLDSCNKDEQKLMAQYTKILIEQLDNHFADSSTHIESKKFRDMKNNYTPEQIEKVTDIVNKNVHAGTTRIENGKIDVDEFQSILKNTMNERIKENVKENPNIQSVKKQAENTFESTPFKQHLVTIEALPNSKDDEEVGRIHMMDADTKELYDLTIWNMDKSNPDDLYINPMEKNGERDELYLDSMLEHELYKKVQSAIFENKGDQSFVIHQKNAIINLNQLVKDERYGSIVDKVEFQKNPVISPKDVETYKEMKNEGYAPIKLIDEKIKTAEREVKNAYENYKYAQINETPESKQSIQKRSFAEEKYFETKIAAINGGFLEQVEVMKIETSIDNKVDQRVYGKGRSELESKELSNRIPISKTEYQEPIGSGASREQMNDKPEMPKKSMVNRGRRKIEEEMER